MNTKLITRTAIVILAILVVLFGNAWVSVAQENPEGESPLPIPENPAEGFRLFYQKGCMECHAIGGYGGAAAQDLTRAVTEQSFYGIAQMIWNHVPKMSEKYEEEKITWPTITSEEMAKLMPFLSYLNFFDKPGDAEEGEKVLFRDKCVMCHRVGKVGIVKIKPLDEFKKYPSPVFFVTRFWNSGREIGEVSRGEGIELPQFGKNDLMDIIAYIKRSGSEEIEEEKIYLSPPNPKQGRNVFLEKGCTKCHSGGSDPREAFKGVAIGPFTHIVRRMLNHSMWSHPDKPDMPMTPEEMSDLVSYIYFLSYSGKPGDPKIGKQLFVEKRCAQCHGARDAGGGFVPEFATPSKLESPLDVLSGMWNTAPEKMKKEMLEAGVPWPQFEGGELADLFAYVLSAQKR